ncbi:hypothetical protein GCM10027589_20130 [Actinocorallia lasiicapitis]
MRMWLEVAEKDEFAEVAGLLERGCARWAQERGEPVAREFVRRALEFRHLSTDGRLGWWTPEEVRRLLVEWFPSNVASAAFDGGKILGAVRGLIGFLGDGGLLDPRGATAGESLAEIAVIGARYTELINAPREPGPAEIVMTAAFERGIDPADHRAVARLLKEIRDGRTEIDPSVLTRGMSERRYGPQVRKAPQLPVHVPDDDEQRAAAAGALTRWRREGPGLAYHREWAAAVDELPGEDPVEVWRRVFGAFLVTNGVFPGEGELRELYRWAVTELLHTLYGQGFLAEGRVAEAIWHACVRNELPGVPARASERDLVHAGVLNGLEGIIAALTLFGAVTAEGDKICLSGLGTAVMRDHYLAEGREAGRVGELAEVPAAALLGVLADHYPPDTARAELSGWLAVNGGDVAPLLDAVRACPFHGRAALLLDTLGADLTDGSRLFFTLRDDPRLAPYALVRLADSGAVTPEELTEAEAALILAENLLSLLERQGPAALALQFAQLPPETQASLITTVVSSGHPDATGLADFRAAVA